MHDCAENLRNPVPVLADQQVAVCRRFRQNGKRRAAVYVFFRSIFSRSIFSRSILAPLKIQNLVAHLKRGDFFQRIPGAVGHPAHPVKVGRVLPGNRPGITRSPTQGFGLRDAGFLFKPGKINFQIVADAALERLSMLDALVIG